VAETGPALSIFLWCTLISLPVGLVQKIQDGYQEGYVNGMWRAGGSLLGLAGVLIAISLRQDLPILVLVMGGSPVLAMLVNSMVMFSRRRPWLMPKWNSFSQAAFTRIFKNGLLFFVLQLAVAIGFQSDNLVIAHFLGADQVSQYAVPMKLFMLIPSLLNFVITPLWPAYGEAIARRDVAWVIKTFKRSLLLSFGVSLLPSILLVIFGRGIIKFWAGPEIQPDLTLLVGLGLWMVLLSLAGPIAMLLNGANVIGIQIVCATLMAIGNLVLSIVLVQRIGISGPVYGSFVSSLLFSILPLTVILPRIFASWSDTELPGRQ
jgi:O-antigen/teichoic acid export membrane protein